MSLAPRLGVLLICSHLMGQAASDSPHAAPSRAVEANFSTSRASAAPLSASVTASEEAPLPTNDGRSSALASITAPEPGLLLLAGSLTVWLALSRRRVGAVRG